MLRDEDDERPRAYVVTQSKSRLSEREVIEFVNSKVSKIKRITGGVCFLDEIPKNPVRPYLVSCASQIAGELTLPTVWKDITTTAS